MGIVRRKDGTFRYQAGIVVTGSQADRSPHGSRFPEAARKSALASVRRALAASDKGRSQT